MPELTNTGIYVRVGFTFSDDKTWVEQQYHYQNDSLKLRLDIEHQIKMHLTPCKNALKRILHNRSGKPSWRRNQNIYLFLTSIFVFNIGPELTWIGNMLCSKGNDLLILKSIKAPFSITGNFLVSLWLTWLFLALDIKRKNFNSNNNFYIQQFWFISCRTMSIKNGAFHIIQFFIVNRDETIFKRTMVSAVIILPHFDTKIGQKNEI